MIECGKMCLMVLAILFFTFSIFIIINNGFSYKGIYISGVKAYIIAIIDFILGIMLLAAYKNKRA